MTNALSTLETTEAGALKIVSVPCRSDNFAYLVRDASSGNVALIDAPESEAVEAALQALGWTLTHIFITHHHADHVDGVERLRALGDVEVIGSSVDATRLPILSRTVTPGESFTWGDREVRVIDTPGHTVGHIVYHMPEPGVLFSGDTLFAMGCGRLFEGTAQQMWGGLSMLARLPDDTIVFFGHEYTATNADFALTIDPGNTVLHERVQDVIATLEAGGRTTPTTIGLEKATNPFLRAVSPDVARHVGLPDADPEIVFAEIRRRKDAA
jgi:hydroxyacylglutathione hydrolase